MSHAIDQTGRAAIAVGLIGALLLSPLTVAAAGPSADPPRLHVAQAAPPPAPPTASRPAPAGPPAGAPPAAAQGPRNDQLERYLADLHKKLRITPAQEQQFQAFADVMRGNAQAMDAAMHQEDQNRNRNAVEDMRTSERMLEAEAEGLKRLIPVFEALYGSLSDQQKRIADQVMATATEPTARRPGRPPG